LRIFSEEYLGRFSLLKQVDECGNFVSPSLEILLIVKLGSKFLNPSKGCLSQEVTNFSSNTFSSSVKAATTFQKSLM